MRKLAIIHFNPIEKYPPVMNWLDFLAGKSSGVPEIRVYTMRQDGFVQPPYQPLKEFIRICRWGKAIKASPPARYFGYLNYFTRTLFSLIRWKPDTVLYYETLSSWPALIYKKYIRPGTRLFVHYHEYISPAEYTGGMVLNRRFHQLEKKMYPFFTWISHTNKDRMDLFTGENPNIDLAKTHILPNYPPSGWKKTSRKERNSLIKFVYVGALSLDTIYTEEFARWIEKQEGRASWDIFSSNCTPEAKKFLVLLNSRYIHFQGGVEYSALPGLLPGYDIGLVLYKGTIANYVYNIPNKLFEYLACGLDVWVPREMKTSVDLVTAGIYPKIVAMDFTNMERLPDDSIRDHTGLSYSPSPYYCEEVLPVLFDTLMQTSDNLLNTDQEL